MSKSQKVNRTMEDQLADFTDSILDDPEEDTNLSSLDPELRALQQTVLRLKNSFPREDPSETVIHRMRQHVVHQWKLEDNKPSEPFWARFIPARKSTGQKWQSQDSRRRQSLAIYFAVAVILLLASIPLLNGISSAQPAASGQGLTPSIFVALGGLIMLALWFIYRKR